MSLHPVPPVTPEPEDDGGEAKIRALQDRLLGVERSLQQARDPTAEMFGVLADFVGVLHDQRRQTADAAKTFAVLLFNEITLHLAPMLARAEQAAGGALANKAVDGLPGAIDRLTVQRYWRLGLGAGVALVAVLWLGGYKIHADAYSAGRADGEAKAVHLEAALGHELTRPDAEGWLALLQNNNSLGAAPHACSAAQDGRTVCHLDLWASPPVAPVQRAEAAQPPTTPRGRGNEYR